MTDPTLGQFLCPEGFARPPVLAMAREASLVTEAGRYAVAVAERRRHARSTPYVGRSAMRAIDPVVLVPGFLAGDASLRLMAGELRREGYRTYRSQTRANVGCTVDAAAELEQRLESIAIRRDTKVQLVGHSLGGMLARGVAVRRPDLVSGVVTLGSPMLAPGAHHWILSASVELLVRLSRAGMSGLMAEDCVGGACARRSFDECRAPMPAGVGFTAIYSKRDGIVDWRACIDPAATPVEVTASHLGMAVDPRVVREIVAALARHTAAETLRPGAAAAAVSALEVDSGVGA